MANVALAVINAGLFAILLKTTGRTPHYKSAFMLSMGLPFSLGTVGWMVSSVIAIFIQRHLPYDERVGRVSAVAILAVQILFTLFCLSSLVTSP
jgi:hypothetical protein